MAYANSVLFGGWSSGNALKVLSGLSELTREKYTLVLKDRLTLTVALLVTDYLVLPNPILELTDVLDLETQATLVEMVNDQLSILREPRLQFDIFNGGLRWGSETWVPYVYFVRKFNQSSGGSEIAEVSFTPTKLSTMLAQFARFMAHFSSVTDVQPQFIHLTVADEK